MAGELPPLPAGFTLDQQGGESLPPLPDGFTLDKRLPYGPRDPAITAQARAQHPDLFDQNYQYDPTSGMSGGQKFRSGMGKAFVDVGRGAKQLGAGVADVVAPRSGTLSGLITGQPVSRVAEQRANVAASRELDAPLMRSGFAKAGNFAGNVALTLPSLAIPGATTVTGAGLIGAGYGLLQPSTSTKETLLNTGIGGAVGAASQYAGNKIAQGLANRAASKEAAAAASKEANAVRDTVLSEAHDAGYVVPPTAVKQNATNTALESLSGKAATRQAMSAHNAKVTNVLVAQDLGLDAGKPITKEALQGVRNKAGEIYKQVRSIGEIPVDQQFLDELESIAQSGADLEKQFPGIGAQANKQVKKLVSSLSPNKAIYGSADKAGSSGYSLDPLMRENAHPSVYGKPDISVRNGSYALDSSMLPVGIEELTHGVADRTAIGTTSLDPLMLHGRGGFDALMRPLDEQGSRAVIASNSGRSPVDSLLNPRSLQGARSVEAMNSARGGMDSLLNPTISTQARSVEAANSARGGYSPFLTKSKDTFSSNNIVSASRFLRNRATANFKAAFGAGGNPEKLELAQAQSKAVNAIEDLIQRHLESTGNAELGAAWDAARTTIAKTYQAEAALKGGNVSAAVLAKQLQKGRPLSGGMGTAARFADMFEEVAKVPKSGAGVSKLAATLNTAGVGTALFTGNVPAAAGLVAAGTAPYAVRNALVSKAGQSLLATPSYTPNLVGNQTAQFLARYGRVATVPLAIQGSK
jgi:hypothetical protein